MVEFATFGKDICGVVGSGLAVRGNHIEMQNVISDGGGSTVSRYRCGEGQSLSCRGLDRERKLNVLDSVW